MNFAVFGKMDTLYRLYMGVSPPPPPRLVQINWYLTTRNPSFSLGADVSPFSSLRAGYPSSARKEHAARAKAGCRVERWRA